MASVRKSTEGPLTFTTCSNNPERKDLQPSMLYSILPSVIQNRVPTLPSLRRSFSDLRGRSSHTKRVNSSCSIYSPETPPPVYSSRSGSLCPEQANSITSTDTEDIYVGDNIPERPTSFRSASTLPPPFSMPESETGINWKYANQGTIQLF